MQLNQLTILQQECIGDDGVNNGEVVAGLTLDLLFALIILI